MNENTKHTPGPWTVERCHLGQWVKSGESFIAPLPDHLEHDGEPCGSIASQDKSQEEIDANARLIAAAPELLDEMEIEEAWVSNLIADFKAGRTIHAKGITDNLESRRKDIRAAIAKAKGGEP